MTPGTVSRFRTAARCATFRWRFGLREILKLYLGVVLMVGLPVHSRGEPERLLRQRFAIPAQRAERALARFSEQSGLELVFPSRIAARIKTRAVYGSFPPLLALGQMLEGTGLHATASEDSGVVIITSHNPQPPTPMKRSSLSQTRHPLLGLLGFLMAAPLILAQPFAPSSTVDEDEELVRLPIFDVSSERANTYRATDSMSGARIRQALIDTPATINVVTSDFIKDIGAASVIDATQYVSGVGNSHLSGAGGRSDAHTIRGFGIWGTAIDNFVTMNSFQATLDPLLLDRVEITKGPNAVLAPNGAPGGFANALTKSPSFERSQTVRLELVDEYFGNRISYDATGPLPGTKRFSYRLIAGYQDAHSFIPGKILSKSLNPQLTWAISPKAQLKLKGFFINWKNEGPSAYPSRLRLRSDVVNGQTATVDSIMPGFVYDGANGGYDNDLRDVHIRRGTLEFTTALSDRLSMRLAALRQYLHSENGGVDWRELPSRWKTHPNGFPNSERYNPMTGVFTPEQLWGLQDSAMPYDEVTNPYVSTPVLEYPPHVAPRTAQLQHHYANEMHYQADLAGNFEFGGTGRDAVATLQVVVGGVRGRAYDKLYNWESEPGALLDFDYNTGPYPTDQPGRPEKIDSLWRHWVGPRTTKTQVYGTSQLGLFQKRVLLNGGVSRIWVNRPDWIDMLTGSTGSKLRASHNTPFYAALVKVLPQVAVYFSHSENADAGVANNEVFWQKGEQDEVGMKLEFFAGRLSITGAYFDLKQDRVITQNPLYFFDDTLTEYFLLDVTNKGFELDIVGGITPNLTVIASYTDMKLREPTGHPRIGTPDTLLNGLLKYDFSRGFAKGMSVFAGFNHVSKSAGETPAIQYTPLGVLAQISFYVPERTIYSAGASYDYGSLRFQLNVDNLTNKKTLWSSTGRNDVTPYPGRNIRLTTTYTF
ncbi:TonB-dependent siderophore receptor [Cephaloticoccus primus]|nr:TonB-dependent receptor [Cephaloticoccus primus]